MATKPKEPNPLSQSEIIQNFELTEKFLEDIIENLISENGSQSSINIIKACLQRLRFGLSNEIKDLNLVKECLFDELDKIYLKSSTNNWGREHPHKKLLSVSELFDRLQGLQCGRKIHPRYENKAMAFDWKVLRYSLDNPKKLS